MSTLTKYACEVSLECNSQLLDDFKTFTEDPRVLRRAVKLGKKIGVMNVTPQFGFVVAYVVPVDKPEFDFDSIEDGTFTVDYGNGRRVTFTGVATLEVGEARADQESEIVKDIRFVAAARIQE